MSEGNWSIERYLRYASRIESDDSPITLYVTLDNIGEILGWKDKADKVDELNDIINTHYDSIDDWRDDMLEVVER